MSRFLVSFSNQEAYSGRPLLGIVDVQTGEFFLPRQLLDNPDVLASSGGAGICAMPGGYALLLQGAPCRLCYLREDLSLIRVVRLTKVEDGHSIVWTGHSLLAVSTETNAVVEIGADDAESVIHHEGVPDSKSEHLNGIAIGGGGQIMLSGFGNRRGCGQAPRDGFIKNIATGEVVIRNLREPHSVQVYDGILYTLESQTGNLVRNADGRTISCFRKFFGYARGLAFTPEHIVVGQSAIRIGSRTAFGGESKDRRARAKASEGALHVVLANDLLYYPLGKMADEVYDVVAFPDGLPIDALDVVPAGAYLDGRSGLVTGLVHQAWLARNAGDLGKSAALLEQAVERRPEAASFLTALGAVLNRASRWRDAEAVLRRAIAAEPAAAAACSALADTCTQLGQHDEAASLLQTAIAAAPRFKRLRHDLGLQYARLGRLDDAEAVYREMMAFDPEGDSTLRLLADILRAQGRFAEALPHALRAVDLRSDVPEYYDFIAQLLKELKDFARAETYAREAIRFEPFTAEFHETLVRILCVARQSDAAMEAATVAARTIGGDADFAVRLGERIMDVAEPDQMAGWLRDQAKRYPHSQRFDHALSRLLHRRGDFAGAIEAARRACDIAPADPHCHILLGYQLIAGGFAQEAQAQFRQAVEINPNLGHAWWSLGGLLADAGNLPEALQAMLHADRLQPGTLPEKRRIAELALGVGNFTVAAAALRGAIELDRQDAGLHHSLSRALRGLGDTAGALGAAREACRLVPDDLHFREWLKTLGR